ncbi:MAG: methyltransferase domain-containing protein [Spirochaetes bacterium]|jgi:SAM-dependent methyltransferase|nr:methyltransferase domain-containing protein [Spirochaetota bacterium]
MKAEPYTRMADVYDHLLRHVDYDEWYEFIKRVMKRYAGGPGLVLEIGCGTGRFGAKFSRDGYEIYGIDKSMEMLRVAARRAYKNFRIMCADMTRFHLAKKPDFIFSVHDTVNYLMDFRELSDFFSSVRGVMHRGTVFMFDVTTEHNIDENFDGKKSLYELGNRSVSWTNRYDRASRIIYSNLVFTESDGSRYEETHAQRIYSRGEIENALDSADFELVSVYGDYIMAPPADDAVMISFVARTGRR